MANTLEQIIKDLEKQAAAPATAEVAQVVEAQKVAETSTETPAVDTELEGLRKLAADLDEQGRVIFRGFYDELQKVAVGPAVMTPNPATVPFNPAVQVSNGEVREADTAKVEAILNKLTLGGVNKFNPTGTVQTQGNEPVATTQPVVQDEHPVAADVKKANAEIIDRLYEKYYV